MFARRRLSRYRLAGCQGRVGGEPNDLWVVNQLALPLGYPALAVTLSIRIALSILKNSTFMAGLVIPYRIPNDVS